MRSEKKYLITEVEGHLKKSDYVFLANYEKVTVENVAALRKKLAAEGAEFHVVKNSSLRVAAKGLSLPEVDQWLKGQTAVVVGGTNPTGVAKILKDFFKETQKVEVKGGIFEKAAIDAAVVAKLADVPPANVLKSQFLGLLKVKPQQLAALIKAYADKKEKEGAAA
ncbi:MAG: 50S ribosomal protein L10 [Opitutae bacterium]|nr:50S ribosomal protein L10 [Opitutae bacterium]